MKKKIVLSLLLAVLMIVPVFAHDNRIGISGGLSYDWYNVSNQLNLGMDYKVNNLSATVSIDGASFFSNGFGVGYGIILDFPLTAKLNGTSISRDSEVNSALFYLNTTSIYAELLYKVDFTQKLSLETGIGLSSTYGAKRNYNDSRYSRSFVSVIADASLNYEVIDHLLLRAGVRAYVPFYTREKLASTTFKTSYTGIFATGYVGVAYAY